MGNEYQYDKDSLKVEPITKSHSSKRVVENTISEQVKKKENEPMSNKEAFLIILMLIAMYVAISAIPTFIMMCFFNISFLLSQLIVIIGSVVVIWVFGLYKPASDELKAKSRFFH